MPVQYTSIVDEHHAVRRAAGLFDISHMGEFVVRGAMVSEFLNYALTNDVQKLVPGQAQYSLLCNETGGVVDDLYVYRLEQDHFLLVVNASRIAADWDWMQGLVDTWPGAGQVELRDESSEYAAVALQGPKARDFVCEVVQGGSIHGTLVASVVELGKNQSAGFVFQGAPVLVARTGYTGEDGFEFVAAPDVIVKLWDALLTAGAPHGLKPAGLGARDTLRTEACLPLYGHELNDTVTPIEAGLGVFVSMDKGEFVGRPVLAQQKELGPARKCVAFRMQGKAAPPRAGYAVWQAGEAGVRLGDVTSGVPSPTLGVGIGMAYVPTAQSKPETIIEIEVRGRRYPAVVNRKPLYRRPPAA